jgi:hypothetical protein
MLSTVQSGTMATPTQAPASAPAGDARTPDMLTWVVLTVTLLILTVVAVTMFWATQAQMSLYSRGIDAALGTAAQPVANVNHTAALTYSRAITYAVTKTSSLFLAFLLIFLGGIYVLTPKQATYGLDADSAPAKGHLETNSPGLVMVTLGVVLAIASLLIQSTIDYKETVNVAPPATGAAAQSDPGMTHTTATEKQGH